MSGISSLTKIKVYKEACIGNSITEIANVLVALRKDEFIDSLQSINKRDDGNVCANVYVNLYFKSLDIELKIRIRFAISDVPTNYMSAPTGLEFVINTENPIQQNIEMTIAPPIHIPVGPCPDVPLVR